MLLDLRFDSIMHENVFCLFILISMGSVLSPFSCLMATFTPPPRLNTDGMDLSEEIRVSKDQSDTLL